MKKVEIKLHGVLAKEMGRKVFNLAVSSVSEAIHAINILTSNKLNKVLSNYGHEKFNVIINGRKFSHNKFLDPNDKEIYNEVVNSELNLKTNKLETIDIIPVIEASDSDIFAIILGVILIIVGAFTGVGPILGTALIMGGIGIAAAGVINLLSKPPSFEPFQEIGGVTKKSYLFNGPENTIGEGGPVPVGYGRLIVGSQTVSASYDIYNIPIDNGIANSPNNEDVIKAWYFRANENLNFNDPNKKINYFAVSKLSGRGSLTISGPNLGIVAYVYNKTQFRPTTTLGLPQEVFVNYLLNNPALNNSDPTLSLTINDLTGYQVVPEKNEGIITEESIIKRFNIKIYFYNQVAGSIYLNSISGGVFDNLLKNEGGSETIVNFGSISYPYSISNSDPLSVSMIQINNFIPTSESLTISFKNNNNRVGIPVIIVEKAVKTSTTS